MSKKLVETAARAAGHEIDRLFQAHGPAGESPEQRRWRVRWIGETIAEYPVRPQPRWGHGKPAHARIQAVLEGYRPEYERTILELGSHREVLQGIPHEPDPSRPTSPFWNNGWFMGLDAASLVGFILTRKPRTYMEIGSGNSTMFARFAANAGSAHTRIVSIDPEPRRKIDPICDHVLRKPLEDCDLAVFDQLEQGDILFIDGSHRVFSNSDVTVFFLDVLPRLKPNVLIHLHDICWPNDYPPHWNKRFYSEQYILGAMLLCDDRPFRIVLPNQFISLDARLTEVVNAAFRAPDNSLAFPFTSALSFWLETIDRSPAGRSRPPLRHSRHTGSTAAGS